jgi:hypothetical protein
MAQTERIFTTASSGRDRASSFYGSSGSPIRAQATPYPALRSSLTPISPAAPAGLTYGRARAARAEAR